MTTEEIIKALKELPEIELQTVVSEMVKFLAKERLLHLIDAVYEGNADKIDELKNEIVVLEEETSRQSFSISILEDQLKEADKEIEELQEQLNLLNK